MSITPMIYLDGRGVTRDEVLRVAQQAATGFEQLGVSEGDTVALLLRNDFAFFEVQQAAAAVGAYGVAGAICVRIDDRRAAYEMTRDLIAEGHRRLGFILGNPDQAASAERLAGFYAAVREADDVQTTIAQGDFSFTSGLAAAELLLDASPAPTAIFASNDDMAAAVVSVAHRRHLDVPGALTVAGFDDTAAAVTLWPPLTTVRQPVRELAAEALGLLAAQISGAETHLADRRDRVLDHQVVRRLSTSPP